MFCILIRHTFTGVYNFIHHWICKCRVIQLIVTPSSEAQHIDENIFFKLLAVTKSKPCSFQYILRKRIKRDLQLLNYSYNWELQLLMKKSSTRVFPLVLDFSISNCKTYFLTYHHNKWEKKYSTLQKKLVFFFFFP